MRDVSLSDRQNYATQTARARKKTLHKIGCHRSRQCNPRTSEGRT
ncbi:Piso0_000568 [Millerozyma farinosa CBS 7064]|uniref:Piso0_000568 protein n=1 Tax=Pichia sorbitophila (strain ATCC MYA-4447 / BCRC 22081 / CBS 7064 / NBRC 10061 / NRRL Y-12695) TaxID=559304 RepID=G8YSR0_PICSO|nr:Piso0_000568 [Millerozyma farinosa CBS 7064]CCE73522.1 Piso0_000568 [Millerozyma farinosa CBS 7064]